MSKIHNPHDHYFRAAMSDKHVAMDFFKHYLPESIRSVVDLETLQLQKSSFIDENLRASVADMLYAVNFKNQRSYLYLIVEHQRKPDKWMPYRLLRYQVRIMDYHLKKKAHDSLPIILPMVFYNGDKPYPYPTDLFDLFGSHQALAKNILLKPFPLIDLTQTPDVELKAMQWAGVMGLVQKHITTKNFMSFLKELLPMLKHLEEVGAKDYLTTTLKYLFQGDIEDPEEAVKLIYSGLSSNLGGEVMTLAERLEEKGFLRGEKEGFKKGKTLAKRLEEKGFLRGEKEGFEKGKTLAKRLEEKVFLRGEKTGLEKGRLEEKLLIAQQMLLQNMDPVLIHKVTGLTLKQIEELV